MNDRSGENNGGAWENRRDSADQTDSEKHNRQKPPEQFHCEGKSVERLKRWSGSAVMLSKAKHLCFRGSATRRNNQRFFAPLRMTIRLAA
jgi:hypothetical protein